VTSLNSRNRHAGGIWELRKIAAMAESREIGIAPHMPYGPISFMACIHLAAASPNHGEHSGRPLNAARPLAI
jgi:L-alanine-DL-glutamate epimerase-like enolase superfamily enzyme